MVAITATNSATVSLQVTLNKMRLEQARREADQAQAYAQTLQAQADEQEGVVQKARGQVQTLQQQLNAAASGTSSPRKATTTTVSGSDNYIQALAEVFTAAKPLLKSDLSSTQKNVVTSSLLQATNIVAYATPAKAIAQYGSQSSTKSAVGAVVNATA